MENHNNGSSLQMTLVDDRQIGISTKHLFIEHCFEDDVAEKIADIVHGRYVAYGADGTQIALDVEAMSHRDDLDRNLEAALGELGLSGVVPDTSVPWYEFKTQKSDARWEEQAFPNG